MEDKINVYELVNSSIEIIFEASKKIREIIKNNGELQIKNKGDKNNFDPQTIADLTSQRIIVNNLKNKFKNINIIGEENDENNDINKYLINLKNNVLNNLEINELKNINLNKKKITVFVDPLDGTKEFTEGITSAVTILLGVSYRGKPIFGIIHQPWYQNNIQQCYFADYFTNKTYKTQINENIYDNYSWNILEKPDIKKYKNRKNIATSRSHCSEKIEQSIKKINPSNVIRIGGAGNKIIKLIEGNIDCYLFPTPGTSKWDTCAGQIILETMGGILTNIFGEEYIYNNDLNNIKNTNGIIAVIDRFRLFEFL